MWVRGLKLVELPLCILQVMVASYVGAWIETLRVLFKSHTDRVASYVGAWIETQFRWSNTQVWRVASYVGAWIETTC